jgi:Concanavalin A-like lectin/glucanases superfamily
MMRLNAFVTRWLPLAAALVLLAGCGGGADTVATPVSGSGSGTPAPTYSGPAPATSDVQSFKVNVWDNLHASNRCGSCHGESQSPRFVRSDDVNLAYQAANTVVDLGSPKDSLMVTKVGGGHNCWLASDSACADILTTWISNWAGASASGGKQIVLEAPVLKDPGASRSFPDDPGLFLTTVWPVLTEYCSRCHTAESATSQSPYFASADLDTAYAAARSKINLDAPANSRFVIRLRDEFHNCWSDCAVNAAEMQTAIEAFAAQVPLTTVDPSLVLSKALTLYDGTVASGGNRFENNQIALYEFKTGGGSIAYDTSGVEPALNLTLSGDVTWVGGWGINVRDGKAQGSTSASRKLHDLIQATGEYSIEAWVAPGNVTQEEARIVSYSGGTTVRNFTLGQTLYSYDFYARSSVSDANGDPVLTTNDEDEDLQATLQHVVATYDPANGRRIYVNGVYTGDLDGPGGSLADWDDTFAFVLGNEVSSDRQWTGVVRLVAIHNRAMTPGQIEQNYEAGVGEKFFLLFSVSDLVNLPDAYIMFEVSQFDSYAYLFDKPTFLLLDPNARPGSIRIAGMRIGLNGAEPLVGQAYRTLDTTISDAEYTAGGQRLANVGTVIPLEKGPDSDEFFLTFDVLGNNSNVRTDPVPLAPPPPQDVNRPSDVGLRVFAEINSTMSTLTGVSSQSPGVRATYDQIRQSLPTVESVDTFVSAHPVAIAQLAIQYCDALMEDTTARAAYFPGFAFGANPATAYGGAARDAFLNPLLDHALGTQQLATDPLRDDVYLRLSNLIDELSACGAGCASDRTVTIAKATCAALIGSAETLIH